MNRPRGTTLLGLAAIALGTLCAGVCAFLAFVELMGLCNGAFTTTGSGGGSASAAGIVAFGMSLISEFAALALVALGIGTLRLCAWAWRAAVSLFALIALGAVVGLIRQAIPPATHPGIAILSAVAIAVASAVLAYLLAPGIRASFGLGL